MVKYTFNYIIISDAYQSIFIFDLIYAHNNRLLKLNQTDLRELNSFHQLNLRLPFFAHFF